MPSSNRLLVCDMALQNVEGQCMSIITPKMVHILWF